MRILILSGEYPPMLSGMGDYAFHLNQSLKKFGHQTLILTQGNSTAGEGVVCWSGKWGYKAWPFIRKTVQDWQPEIFHLQYMTTTFQNSAFINFLPQFLKQDFPGMKIVTTYHEFASPLKRLALIPLLGGSGAHIVTNDRHFEWLKAFKRFWVLRGKIARIPLAANILPAPSPDGRARARLSLGLKPEESLIVRFGILHDISLPLVLRVVKAFSKIFREGIPARLLLIGKGEPRAVACLRERIKEEGLCEAVILKLDLDPEQISFFLSASDLGLALYEDGVSEKRTAFLSVLAHGLPVLATRRGNLPSELRENENVVCVPVNETEEGWAAALKKLIRDEPLRRRLASGGKKVAALHDWGEIGRLTLDLYGEMT